jgi:hypothetical protein
MQGALHLSRRQSLQGLVVLGAGAALDGDTTFPYKRKK